MSRQMKKVMDLAPGSDGINVRVRVLEAGESRVVETRSGSKTLSEALVGDETGRIGLTLWGDHAGKLKKGQVVEVQNAFTTAFRGKVQLNVGNRGSIQQLDDSSMISAEEIPEESPEAPEGWRPRRQGYGRRPRGGFRR
jgi:replication factor A1